MPEIKETAATRPASNILPYGETGPPEGVAFRRRRGRNGHGVWKDVQQLDVLIDQQVCGYLPLVKGSAIMFIVHVFEDDLKLVLNALKQVKEIDWVPKIRKLPRMAPRIKRPDDD